MYEAYLESNTFSTEATRKVYEDEGYYIVSYVTEYEGEEFEITMIDKDEQDFIEVHILI